MFYNGHPSTVSISPPVPVGLGRIGPWRVVRRLGRGGVASVYEVLGPDSGRRVALKLFRDPSVSRSIGREYRALAGLDHPGIVRVLGRGDYEGCAYLLMELVVGRAAQACARHAGVPGSPGRTALTLRVVHALLEALTYLHRRGIVHRDIKSSNVLADLSGQVKLLDLGTAGIERRERGSQARVPGLDRFAGTVTYASPEQLQGRALDGRSDLFSVGVLWYRMLTGGLPFGAQSRDQAILERNQGAPPTPHGLFEGIPEPVGELVMGLLESDALLRPSDADGVLRRLRPLLVSGGARPVSLWPDPPPIFGRRSAIDELDAFLSEPSPRGLCLVQGAPGEGVPELMRWTGQEARRAGRWVLAVSAVGDGPGNLISRLLLAVPRHVRKGLRGMGESQPRSSQRVARAVELLVRLDRALDRAVLLQLFDLQRCSPAELAELRELLQIVERRGLAVRTVGSWEHHQRDLPGLFEGAWPGLCWVQLSPMDDRAAAWHLRSLVGGRVLAPTLEASLLRDAGGRPQQLSQALRAQVEGGRLRQGRTPEGTACWLETLAGLDEPMGSVEPGLAALLSQPVDGPPWVAADEPSPASRGIDLVAVLAGAPEDHPEPRVRAVLHAWRGHGRTCRGDRDLQADADLFQAEEDLRSAQQAGWNGALGWREYVGLIRAGHLADRGRHMEAQRRLADAPRAVAGAWQRERRGATRLSLAIAEGLPELPSVDPWPGSDGGLPGLTLAAQRASWLLQRGELDALLEPAWSLYEPIDAWTAEAFARLVSARAGALRLRGELSRGVELVECALLAVGRWTLAPPRVRLLLSLAELELELFRPGVAREHLADCFVLLRHCDRPELSAGRERIRGRVALSCGEPARAEGAFRTGANMLRGTGFHVVAAELQAQLARALARLGRRREAVGLLAPAQERLAQAQALPGMSVACAAAWEASGYRDPPDSSWAPVLAWMSQADPLLLRCGLARARLRHAAVLQDLEAVRDARSASATLLRRVFDAQSPEDRAILVLHPRMRALRS